MLLYGVEHPLVWTVRDSVTDSTPGHAARPGAADPDQSAVRRGQVRRPGRARRHRQLLPALAARRRIDPSLACLVRSVRLLAPGGVLGIVLPDGVIAGAPFERAGASAPSDVDLVRWRCPLPTATFALSGTVAKTSAVFLRRGAARAESPWPG